MWAAAERSCDPLLRCPWCGSHRKNSRIAIRGEPGAYLRALRAHLRLTIDELAKVLFVKAAVIVDVESGSALFAQRDWKFWTSVMRNAEAFRVHGEEYLAQMQARIERVEPRWAAQHGS